MSPYREPTAARISIAWLVFSVMTISSAIEGSPFGGLDSRMLHPGTYSELSACGKSPSGMLAKGDKTVESRHRVMRRTGAVEEAACRISANPRRSVRRFCPISEARVAPDRDQLWFTGLERPSVSGARVGRYATLG